MTGLRFTSAYSRCSPLFGAGSRYLLGCRSPTFTRCFSSLSVGKIANLHDFYAGGIRFGVCVDDEPELIVDERGARLGAVAKVGGELVYHYDFGDDWEHRIVVESAIANGSDVIICADGARACPPEDCGGPLGYENLLRVLADPNDEEHASMKQWVGRRFEPERFEPAALNKRLATLSRRRARGTR